MADDDLAYGHYPGQPESGEGERSLVGDTFRKLQQNDSVGSIFTKLQEIGSKVGGELESRLAGARPGGSYAATGASRQSGQHRYASFAPPRDGNDVKWYPPLSPGSDIADGARHVDGCAYFWAVSVALEQAKESIWILDCAPTPLTILSPRLDG